MSKRGWLGLVIVVAAVNLGGCASVAKEVVKQVMNKNNAETGENAGENAGEDAGSGQNGEDQGNWQDGEDQENRQGGADRGNTEAEGQNGSTRGEDGSGNYEQFIQSILEPRLGTAKNEQFTYGFERIDYEGYNNFFASPMRAALENGMIGTYRRDLNKDGRDELLVAYIEGSRQSSDGKNRFCLSVYGDTDSGIEELGKISFDDCFFGSNGEEYLFGLKDLGNKRLIYAGATDYVWTWADGVSPEIHLYQMENNQISEIYSVAEAGSDNSWLIQWRSELQSYGFDLANMDWNECNLEGESGFEVLAYGECHTEDLGNGNTAANQQYWLDNGRITGSIYGPNSQVVMQMNQSMRGYSGGGQGTYPGGTNQGMPAENVSGSERYSGSSTADYILPNSSSTYLTQADLAGLTQEQLRLARNEIYARHGRKFKTKEIQDYFNSKSWYVGMIESDSFKDDYLNSYEKENIKRIQSMEK